MLYCAALLLILICPIARRIKSALYRDEEHEGAGGRGDGLRVVLGLLEAAEPGARGRALASLWRAFNPEMIKMI
jgi:hypothetical protein